MNIEIKSTGQLEQMIAEARKAEQTSKAALLVNGQPMYTAEQHDQRVQTIETQRRQAIDAVKREVQRRVSEIDEQLLPADSDPVTNLKGEDLARAAALAPFVKEDIAAGNVAAKLRAVLRSGDKPTRALWLRYLSVPGERGLSRWEGEVQAMVKELEAIVRPPDRRQDALRERQAALTSIVMTEATTAYLQRTYHGARR
jgi:hypothetical protein